MHYRMLHKRMNPASYGSIAIRRSNYLNFRACAEPELFQQLIIEHTDFKGNLTASDKEHKSCQSSRGETHNIFKHWLLQFVRFH